MLSEEKEFFMKSLLRPGWSMSCMRPAKRKAASLMGERKYCPQVVNLRKLKHPLRTGNQAVPVTPWSKLWKVFLCLL